MDVTLLKVTAILYLLASASFVVYIFLARERISKAVLHARPEDVPSDFFSAAILSGVLHHVPHDEHKALVETVRYKLRPGGRIGAAGRGLRRQSLRAI